MQDAENVLNLQEIPKTPGIYKFFSKSSIIYIGKAKNLKSRVSSYFGNSLKDRKTQKIKLLTDRIETFSTSTEAEALLLEQSLIKENLPRFNILLRDDKTYPYIHFSMNHKFPGISMKRSKHSVTSNFFGPFINMHAVKATIKDIQKIYQVRNCSDSTFSNRSRPCIEHQMNRCSAPCVKKVSAIDYALDIESAHSYLSSSGKQTKRLLTDKMEKLAHKQDFEQANIIKQRIASLELLRQEQSVNSKISSADFFACTSVHGKTGACILSIRDGKIRGTKTYYFTDDLLGEIDILLESLIFTYYQNKFSLPEKIIFTMKSNHPGLIQESILLKFEQSVRVLNRLPPGSKSVAKLAELNANQVIENKVKTSEKYCHAMSSLASQLGLRTKDIKIEGIDVSHHSGSHAVASIVKFSNQGAEKKLYKLYNIPKEYSGNDVGSLTHVLERRLLRRDEHTLPDILLVDGGKHQLNAALKVFADIDVKAPMILSIVKGSNRIRATETILSEHGVIEFSSSSAGFILLQQIRDESHRFAIINNRKKKNKAVKYSILDSVGGLGPSKKRNLLKEFKSIRAIKNSSINELCRVEGISIKIAERIQDMLKTQ
jgi:excinuclease ABC subunit C